jgi:hypothetical protein
MKKKLLKGVGLCPDAVLDSMHLCMQASPSASYPIQRTALPCTHLSKEKKSSFRGRKKGKAQKKLSRLGFCTSLCI